MCVRQLKAVRRQFNEYETMTRTLLYMTLAFISYAVVVVVVLADDYITCRRVAILCEHNSACPHKFWPNPLLTSPPYGWVVWIPVHLYPARLEGGYFGFMCTVDPRSNAYGMFSMPYTPINVS